MNYLALHQNSFDFFVSTSAIRRGEYIGVVGFGTFLQFPFE